MIGEPPCPARIIVLADAKALAGIPFGYILYDYEDQSSIGQTLGATSVPPPPTCLPSFM